MSILWMDSFDYLGTDNANLSIRGYVGSISGATAIVQDSAIARTGTGSIFMFGFANDRLIRIADNPLDLCVAGLGFFVAGIPGNTNANMPGMNFRTGVENQAIRIVVNANAGMSVFVNNINVGSSANNLINATTWYWLETKVISGTDDGSIEVRLNGATILVVNGLTIPQITGYGFGVGNDVGIPNCRFDDFVVNDEDFLNDRRIVTLYPNADTSLAEWTPSSGTEGYSLIDEASPNDGGFITANAPADISEFDKDNIPLDVNSVAAVCVIARAFKDNAGPSTFTLGVNSAGNVLNSPQFSPNTSVNYFSQIFDENPDGNIPWTKDAVNDATVRVTRVV